MTTTSVMIPATPVSQGFSLLQGLVLGGAVLIVVLAGIILITRITEDGKRK